MALTDKLTAIGDAIRDKTGSTDLLTLDAMPTAISGITTGGGDLPEEAYTITGDCSYRFANNGWNWFIKNYKNEVVSSDITNAECMFYKCTELTEIPFDINIKENTDVVLDYTFKSCEKLKTIPKINNARVKSMQYIFQYCKSLREIPSDYFETWDWSTLDAMTSSSYGYANSIFTNCYSLRSIPMEILKHANPNVQYMYSYFYNGFQHCYSLDEIIGLPIPYIATWTTNGFSNTFTNCGRLKRMTFALQEDGTPYVMNWKSQTIDLSTQTGYTSVYSNITDYNSGITKEKRVSDDTTYQALKDDPDWFTSEIKYSRYNHDSAVETINSLPDTSAYLATQTSGKNTIKFRGACGELTDGGAINTMTEEEIAVATARGWTVAFVQEGDCYAE